MRALTIIAFAVLAASGLALALAVPGDAHHRSGHCRPGKADPGCTPPPPPSSEWTFCANEWERCNFTGTRDVRYGKEPTWTAPRTFTDGVECTNAVFGDPLVGVGKECQTRPASTTPPSTITETRFAGNLVSPTAMEFSGSRLFISEKGGLLRVQENNVLSTFRAFSVETCGESGLLDTAHDAAGNVYVYYTGSVTGRNRVSRISGGTETVLLDNISGTNCNHQGGALALGTDGKLYIGVGDDQISTEAQSTSSLRGKILRINVDGTIPADNPFGNAVWARGLRNPFTMDVASDGRIYVNDVGEGTFEEVNALVRGANYGWPTCEGPCSVSGMTNPIHAYGRSIGQAITGAAFYSGSTLGLTNVYFFGDYLGGWIKYLDSSNVRHDWRAARSPVAIKAGPDGALYYLSIFDGAVYRVGP